MPLINEFDCLLVLRTFSKLYSCAGLRIGYVSGNEQLIHYIENAESTFNVNNVAILFAEELMKRPDINSQLVQTEAEGKKRLTDRLTARGYKVFAAEGNYVLFKPYHSSEEIVGKLKRAGVWTRDYSRGILAGWIRVSTGSVKCMDRFFEELEKADTI